MKKIFTFLAFVISLSAFAQKSNLIVFNNGGQQFFVILNGIKQNSVPKTNVKIEGLAPSAYKVKIIFADGKTGDIDKNIYLEPSMEYSAQVVIKNAKKRSLRLFDMVALNSSPYGNGSETVTYRPNESVNYSDQPTNTGTVSNTGTSTQNPSGSAQTNAGTNGQTLVTNPDGSQTITTIVNGQATTVTTNANGTGQVNTNVSGVNVPAGATHTHADGTVHDYNHNVVTTTTTNGHTTTATSGTHTHADGTIHDQNHNPVNSGKVNSGTHTHADGTVHDQNHKPINAGSGLRLPVAMGTNGEAIVNSNGTLTCNSSINNVDFLINGIKEKSMSSDQMDLVKSELRSKCITSDQASKIVNSFTFDGDKIAMAKFCYDHMTDKNNASKLLDLFQFSTSKDELKKYFGK